MKAATASTLQTMLGRAGVAGAVFDDCESAGFCPSRLGQAETSAVSLGPTLCWSIPDNDARKLGSNRTRFSPLILSSRNRRVPAPTRGGARPHVGMRLVALSFLDGRGAIERSLLEISH